MSTPTTTQHDTWQLRAALELLGITGPWHRIEIQGDTVLIWSAQNPADLTAVRIYELTDSSPHPPSYRPSGAPCPYPTCAICHPGYLPPTP